MVCAHRQPRASPGQAAIDFSQLLLTDLPNAGTPFVARSHLRALEEVHLACRGANLRWRLHSAARTAAVQLSAELELDHALVK